MTTQRHLLAKIWLMIGLLLMGIGLVACAPADNSGSDSAGGSTVPATVYIDGVDVLLMESFPLQARAVVRGNLPDGCTRISGVTAERNGDTFVIAIAAERDADAMCTQALVPFEENVTLDILGLDAGSYTVQAGDASASFTLDVANE